MSSEAEFYAEIIEQVLAILKDKNETFVWKCKKTINLMNYLKSTDKINYIKNGIKLILSLFEDYYIDLVIGKNVDLDSISKREKEILIRALKQEIKS